ncbi:MAG: hypothetical protein A2665_00695 [Candidatus Zambryskibacteria bacterium RIFCSPHIGHO2_01_FULL_46_30]|uniref:DUF8128 domain-containing protein n=1 Tax=Candidatus Zambryskibacteria bacterium RIFCSPHIGHO2_01_FULL_46_30 TaxID=1802739 RepID=A0A1G2T0G4_9BACT|nr:MAG: hypothetical protein A2665_00695 [Candidatus Zambryskibacteria bacterium RIFCSPHIGHO2_01_FULL_46_30]OHB05250.1 MAG: hypothetical protein A3B22_03140 [Candidatus Zambryskibacteria bacterium RIFCSPLOWO2_01_FULL_47_33]
MIEDFISLFQADFYLKVWRFALATWPVWLPLSLVSFLFSTWFAYKRREWLKKTGSILLEIKIPKNTDKTPAAMEMVIEGIWEDVIGSLTGAYLEGEVRDVFSLEMVSIGGEVKFFIWAFPKWKSIIESRIYAHYPGAEVTEVEDYAVKVIFDPTKMNLWGITTRLVKPDAYPIKTYIDFELDKAGKEQEEIIDPLAPVLEYLGTLKPGEQAWIQIVIQGHRKEGLQDTRLFSKPDWREGIKKEIKKIIEEEPFIKPEAGQPASLFNLTKVQSDTIASIQRNSAKLAFDSMMRVVYVAPKEIYVRTRGVGIIGSMRQFGSRTLNGIRPHKFIPGIVYPWEDFLDIRRKYNQRTLLEAYKRRSFFNVPFKHVFGKPYVLTTEELATIFHFPGATVTTPTLIRVPSKRAEAPLDLPV